jgi:hypothetical protein
MAPRPWRDVHSGVVVGVDERRADPHGAGTAPDSPLPEGHPLLPWSVRLIGVLVTALVALLGLEAAAALVEQRAPGSSLWWLPLSLALLVWVGWFIVRRIPLAWGVLAGATLYGTTCLLAFPLKFRLSGGPFAWPRDADALFVLTALVIQVLIGALAGFAGGMLARRRRRRRQRAEALAVVASTRTAVLEADGGAGATHGLQRRTPR